MEVLAYLAVFVALVVALVIVGVGILIATTFMAGSPSRMGSKSTDSASLKTALSAFLCCRWLVAR